MRKNKQKILLLFFILLLLIFTLVLGLRYHSQNSSTWLTYINKEDGFSIKHPLFLGKNYIGLPAGFETKPICNNQAEPTLYRYNDDDDNTNDIDYAYVFGSSNCEPYSITKISFYLVKELNEHNLADELGKENKYEYKVYNLNNRNYLIAVNSGLTKDEFNKFTENVKTF